MNNRIICLLLFLFCLVGLPFQNALASARNTDNTRIELFSDGNKEILAHIQIRDGWHIYWQNPGEIGRPTVISAIPDSSNMQIFNFSTPQIAIAHKIIEEYIYKGQTWYLLSTELDKLETLTFSYVECSDVCKPETLTFSRNEITTVPPKEWHRLKQQAEQTFPEIIDVVSPQDQPQISFTQPLNITNFIPAVAENVIPDSIQLTNDGIRWQNMENTRLDRALLLTPDKSYLLNISYTRTVPQNIIILALLAFLGGIILNAMPCVFPVLSLKIMTLLKKEHTGGNTRNALLYSFGVLLSFWLLTTILVFLKHQGEAIGWGFQLQSPIFVGIMAVIFLLLFVLMLEIIPFPTLFNNKIYQLAGLNSFSTGFFSVLIASPCTGPFMGAAVGYAFMQGTEETYIVFTTLALGYALPYALIELYPAVLERVLPKPGKWMQTVKYILSLPLLLTSLWLFSVLLSQLKITGTAEKSELLWQPYDTITIEQQAAEGENIFIDFTADWCLTCQFNEKFLLNTDRFKTFVAENNILLYKADLTDDNPLLIKALEAYGRDSIPAYIYYSNGKYKVLPLFFRLKDLQISNE